MKSQSEAAVFKFEDVIVSNPDVPVVTKSVMTSAGRKAELDAIDAAIAEKMKNAPAPAAKPATKEKAAKLKSSDVAPGSPTAKKEVAAKPTADPSIPKVIRYAKDDCFGCIPADTPDRVKASVKWAATFEDIEQTKPIWKCTKCGRTVERKARTAAE